MRLRTKLLLAHIGVSYVLYMCLAMVNEVPWFQQFYPPQPDRLDVLLSPVRMPLHVVGLVLFPCIVNEFSWVQSAVALPVVYLVGVALAYSVLTKSRLLRERLDARRVTRIVSGVSLVLLACLLYEWVRSPMVGLMVHCIGSPGWDGNPPHGALGFDVSRFHTYAADLVFLTVPSWFLTIITGVTARPWLLNFWRDWIADRRARLGQCLACGYDLRASKERCPECGMLLSRAIEPGCSSGEAK